MASPPNKKHWPSMFRSKHGSQLWQPQPDMVSSPPSLVSGSALKSHFLSGARGEERGSSDPKPRWCPRPEQIRILEAIFNSGMVNPPRDEIPRIRMRLQEYGQVGDANVFYWFQNRKSRSKVKARAAAARAIQPRTCPSASSQQATAPFTPPPAHPTQPQSQQHLIFSPVAPSSSSSSSSDRSSGSSNAVKPASKAISATVAMDLLPPLPAECQQKRHYQPDQPVMVSTLAHAPAVGEFLAADVEPIFLQRPQGNCLTAGELGAIFGAQYMQQVHVQQPPPASPAGTLLGLYNELTTPTSTALRCTPCVAGQYWAISKANQPNLGKSYAPLSTPVPRQEAHDDATKMGMLQYGFGVSTAPTLNSTSPDAVLPFPASPAVTVASAAATTAGLTSLPATTLAAGAVTFDQLLGPADAGFVGTVAGGGVGWRGAAAVCLTGTGAVYDVPATHFGVKACFGEGAVLFRCDGEHTEPLLVDETTGLTVQPLQHGGVYYCVMI